MSGERTCTDCGGSGTRWMGVGGPPIRPCPRCGGSGVLDKGATKTDAEIVEFHMTHNGAWPEGEQP